MLWNRTWEYPVRLSYGKVCPNGMFSPVQDFQMLVVNGDHTCRLLVSFDMLAHIGSHSWRASRGVPEVCQVAQFLFPRASKWICNFLSVLVSEIRVAKVFFACPDYTNITAVIDLLPSTVNIQSAPQFTLMKISAYLKIVHVAISGLTPTF